MDIPTHFLNELKQLVLKYTAQVPVKVYLIGSRAKGNARRTSDIDIALLPLGKLPDGFIISLQDLIEESTIPYQVDIIDLSKLSQKQQSLFLTKAILWKD